MNLLKLKVPPLILVFVCFLLMLMTSSGTLTEGAVTIRFTLWGAISLTAAAVSLLGVWEFKRHQTTVNPMVPKSSASLVRSGIFQYSRNPMYLGFLLFLLAFGILLGDIQSLLVVPLFFCYITVFQIIPEERALQDIFGNEYKKYQREVRRWL
ncbi:methyltransferase family protein [Vibrio ulleungensis]|uniref:Isoprenylcysteine carboxylmethyltransferase family protein n=1 Tax=Vibrio ulleungensis TaxID=2807619 RepID=A0ABS2HFC5_9VIBR|nr:isoprenylcysteine carboxylmethyltransferase family protein [Vibrio ulleungensis]